MKLIIDELTDNQRIDAYLAEYMQDFSRSKIPFERNPINGNFYGHLGIYGYKRKALETMTSLTQTPLEKTESLEQLRALENGMRIKTSVVDFVPVGIDTKEDLEKFRQIVEAKLSV